jgi:hypothetical protein
MGEVPGPLIDSKNILDCPRCKESTPHYVISSATCGAGETANCCQICNFAHFDDDELTRRFDADERNEPKQRPNPSGLVFLIYFAGVTLLLLTAFIFFDFFEGYFLS